MSFPGYKQTEEHIRKRALALTGKKHSMETRLKISQDHKGICYSPGTRFQSGVYQGNGFKKGMIPHNYKGGISTESVKVRTSFEYRKWRKSVFQRDAFT